jgi:ATP-dependent DNA helicase
MCAQMTRMLDLLDTYLEQLGHAAVRIDGSIAWQERQEAMRAFNADPDCFAFLLRHARTHGRTPRFFLWAAL